MDLASASYAGIVAGGVIAIFCAVGRSGGLIANSEMMLGTIVVGGSPALAWVTGAAMSVATYGLVGVLYAIGFEFVTHRAGILPGLGLAVVHTMTSGLALAVLPAVHPLMRNQMSPRPGIFTSSCAK